MKIKKKILFIGPAHGSHTHAWVNLLDHSQFEVRVFGVQNSDANSGMKCFTYNFDKHFPFTGPLNQNWVHQAYRIFIKKFLLRGESVDFQEKYWLSRIIKVWQPDIIHTLGFDAAAYFYLEVKKLFKFDYSGVWVTTVRGGPELAVFRLLPEKEKKIKEVLTDCDQLIADNNENYQIAIQMGLNPKKVSSLGFVPGTGGVDIEGLMKLRKKKTAESRLILWPKAYECIASKATPVLEAIKIAWPKIKPCKIIMTATMPETALWFETLPAEIKKFCQIGARLDRDELLKIMGKARVLLAPSLLDGIPNSLYEAMATGALPIFSPLETIKKVVKDKKNVLFARNLYPEEIAQALVKAMNDDKLVNAIVQNNFRLVKVIADRKKIAQKVNAYYDQLVDKHLKTNL